MLQKALIILMQKILLFIFILLGHFGYSQAKPTLSIKPLTENFYVHITYGVFANTIVPANGLVVNGDSVLLIDTGWDTIQLRQIMEWTKINLHKPIAYCIVTHFHEDRASGIAMLQQYGVKVFALKATDEKLVKEYGRHADIVLPEDSTFNIGNLIVTTYYPGAGHTKDNVVIWFPQQKILFGGCLVKSSEVTDLGNLADADVKQWPASIKNVMRRFGNAEYIIPGHQSWTDKNSLQHTYNLLLTNKPLQ